MTRPDPRPSRPRLGRWTLAAIAFAGHTPGLKLVARSRFTPQLVRVNVGAAGLTVLAMLVAGLWAPAGATGWWVLVAWLVGHFAWSVVFAAWIVRGGAIAEP